jgi:hypothetical protein
MKQVIDNQTANDMFNEFCESWEIDYDITNMNLEERMDFSRLKFNFIKATTLGRLVFNDSGILTYTISDKSESSGQAIEIKRPKGAAYMEMDRYKDQQGVHKTYAVLAAMTGKDSSFFSKLDGIDLKPFMSIVTLFLAG